jgi:hypothetical protein
MVPVTRLAVSDGPQYTRDLAGALGQRIAFLRRQQITGSNRHRTSQTRETARSPPSFRIATRAGRVRAGSVTIAGLTLTLGLRFDSLDDVNHDFVPDCDLNNRASNGECGAMANQSFGTRSLKPGTDPRCSKVGACGLTTGRPRWRCSIVAVRGGAEYRIIPELVRQLSG